MTIAEVSLEQVLQFRDERRETQERLRSEFKLPLISFTMNIAGPRKRSALIDFAFDRALEKILSTLGSAEHVEVRRCAAGCEAFAVYDRDPKMLKEQAVALEEGMITGRLLDIDVIGTDGDKLSRAQERRCLVCGGPVIQCARSRAHSLEELREKTEQLLKRGCMEELASLAVKALIDEAVLTPKPGLVDSDNNGAHRDMDLALMKKSALSLKAFFAEAAEIGYEAGPDCAEKLQRAGVEAEKTMLQATGGVNTHRGAIFSLGLLCAAAGARLSGQGDIFETAAATAAKIKSEKRQSHGSRVETVYGAMGARGEAAAGFPSVQKAVRMLRAGSSELTVLMALIAETEDTNVLWRGGEEGLRFLHEAADAILRRQEPEREALIRALDGECIRRNLSPGGAADMLACALFVRALDFPLEK